MKWLAPELDLALAVVRMGTHLCVMVRIWLASELHVALVVEDYYMRRRTAPSVMGLSPAPSVLAWWEFVGGAPSVMVLRW